MGFQRRAVSEIVLTMGGVNLAGVHSAPARQYALPCRHGGRALIHSACFIPAEFDAGSDDERRLGIALSGLAFDERDRPADAHALGGFHPRAAGDAALWTDGTGEISIPPQARSLTLRIAALPQAWHRI